MNLNTKLELALDIISTKIAMESRNGYGVESEVMQDLIRDKSLVYCCDERALDKVIQTYGPEIKQEYKES